MLVGSRSILREKGHCLKSSEDILTTYGRRENQSRARSTIRMDAKKCAASKAELDLQPEPPVVRAEQFFDGNDDTGSIGCNLSKHPGMAAFQEILTGLESRSDVQAVYAQITELDP